MGQRSCFADWPNIYDTNCTVRHEIGVENMNSIKTDFRNDIYFIDVEYIYGFV